jgi:hypothetical protein
LYPRRFDLFVGVGTVLLSGALLLALPGVPIYWSAR